MVEWKKLGEIAEITIGEFVHKNKQNPNGKYPVYNGGIAPTGFYDNYNNTENKIVISARGATAGFVNMVLCKYWAGNSSYSIDVHPILSSWLFVFYYLKSYQSKLISDQQKGGGIPSISKKQVQDILIPIPSLDEQNRIVGILDTFTSSIDNLKQQIAQRRKQYEYYRDQLLDLEGKEGVEMKTLKDVFDTRNGYTPSTSNSQFWDDGIIPWFKMEDIRDNGRILNDSNLHITTSAIKGKGLFKANSIILATSATIGEHALITVEHLSNQRFTNFYPKEYYLNIINMKFVYYYMYRIDEWCKQHINQGGFASVDMGGLYNLEIPIPSLQEQQRIVSILDTFEASIQNLEAQLSQREKQYEYYRNKLLTYDRNG